MTLVLIAAFLFSKLSIKIPFAKIPLNFSRINLPLSSVVNCLIPFDEYSYIREIFTDCGLN